MKSEILSEVYRIREIMGVKSGKVLKEGILDDIIELMTKKGVSTEAKAAMVDAIKKQYPTLTDAQVKKNVDDFIDEYKQATTEAERKTVTDTYFPNVADDVFREIFQNLPKRTKDMLALEAILLKKYPAKAKDLFNQINYDLRYLDDSNIVKTERIQENLRYLNEIRTELEQIGTAEADEIIRAIDSYETRFAYELETRKQSASTTKTFYEITTPEQLYTEVNARLKKVKKSLHINQSEFDNAVEVAKKAVENGELKNFEDIVKHFIDNYGVDRITAVNALKESAAILKGVGENVGEGTNLALEPIGAFKNKLGLTTGVIVTLIMLGILSSMAEKAYYKDDDYYWRNKLSGFDDLSTEAQEVLKNSINIRSLRLPFEEEYFFRGVDEKDKNLVTLETSRGTIKYTWDEMNGKYNVTDEGKKLINSFAPTPSTLTYDEMVDYLAKAYNLDSKAVKDNTKIERNSNGDNNIYIVTSGDTVKTYEKVNDNGEYRIIEK